MVFLSGSCEVFDVVNYKWRSQGKGTFRSEGAEFFQFWWRKRLLTDDYISGLVLRPGQSGRTWRWHDPEYADGPSDYRHAVRFKSREQARRFHEEWNSS